ncbi:MAG: histidine kinase dimerization/phosphoacceptor domain -containing protein [Desulforhopalus sp.]
MIGRTSTPRSSWELYQDEQYIKAMPSLWKKSIGVKFFGILAVVIVLAMGPLAYVVLLSVNIFGTYSATINKDQIKQQAVSSLSRLSLEQGGKYEEYFNRISAASSLMSVQAGQIYDNLQGYAQMCDTSPVMHYQKKNGMFLTPRELPILTAYWGGQTLTPEITLEVKALTQLDPVLIKTKMLLPDSIATQIITVSGIGRYYTWSEKGREVVRNLPKVSEFDLREGAPLTIFTKGNQSTRRTQWTGIYKDDVIEGLMITASGPIVDSKGVLRGEIGIDLPLQTVVEDVLLDSSLNEEDDGRILFSFLVDSKGRLIAFPVQHMPVFGFDINLHRYKHSGDLLQYNLAGSSERGFRNIVSRILRDDNAVQEFPIQQQRYIVASRKLPSLGWTLGLVTRENDLISSVQRTQNALQGTLTELKRKFVVNSLIIGCIALLLVYQAVRYFVSPLKKLSSIAQQVGEGNLSVRCTLKRTDELGLLGNAINDMICKLAQADEMKVNYFRRLEGDIQDRTRDLEEKNRQLKRVVEELRVESEQRQKITRALQESDNQLRSIMESSIAGLCIIQKGKFRYVNRAIVKMFGYSRKELVSGMGPANVICSDYFPLVRQRYQKKEDKGFSEPMLPYHIKCRKNDGSIFDALVEGAITYWQGLPATVGTVVDVSQLKKVEKKLKINEKRLQTSLEEKNVLLREVYHRTKNNMLVIISMLALQMDGIEDGKARKVFVETENRIRAMALVHENLCQSSNLAAINLGEYLEKMILTLVDSMTFGDRITVQTQCRPLTVSFEKAVNMGLVINELVTNSVKHAFPGDRDGEVSLVMKQDGSSLVVVVADNGIGLPTGIDVHNSRSFGLQITASMIEKQLQGHFEVERKQGTRFTIRLADMFDHKRDRQDACKDFNCRR